MGNGTRRKRDKAKARPLAAAAELGQTILGADLNDDDSHDPDPIDYCELQRTLQTDFYKRNPPDPGDPITLVAGDVPYIFSISGEQLGLVTDPQATAIRQCLRDGYRMRGVVTEIHAEQGSGLITISGSLG